LPASIIIKEIFSMDIKSALNDLKIGKKINGTEEFKNSVLLEAIKDMKSFIGPRHPDPAKAFLNLSRIVPKIGCKQTHANAWFVALRLACGGTKEKTRILTDQNDVTLYGILSANPADESDVIDTILISNDKKPAPNWKYTPNTRLVHLRTPGVPQLYKTAAPATRYVMNDNYIVDVYEKCTSPSEIIESAEPDFITRLAVKTTITYEQTTSTPEYIRLVAQPHPDSAPTAVNHIYNEYNPIRVWNPALKGHPARLVESKTLTSTTAPFPNIEIKLPRSSIEKGFVSDVQFEPIMLAMAAHEKRNADDERLGFLINDGTGAGKTNAEIGIIAANIAAGRKKHIYFTEKRRHIKNVIKAMNMLNIPRSMLFELSDYKHNEQIPDRNGILFVTYSNLQMKDEEFTRLEQIKKFCGKKFDGVIIFDEAHNLQNAEAEEAKFIYAQNQISQQALAANMLQLALPDARIVYASATASPKVNAFSYMTRLNLWGNGTPFDSWKDFSQSIESQGLSGIECLSSHLIASGLTICRTLSLSDVKYETLDHHMTSSDENYWDQVAETTTLIRQNMENAWKLATQPSTSPSNLSAVFEMNTRRISELLLLQIKIPAIIKNIQKQIEEGESAVIQLTNTFETVDSDTEYSLQRLLTNLLDICVPVTMKKKINGKTNTTGGYNDALNANDKTISVPSNQEFHDKIIALIKAIPEYRSPLDTITDTFGHHSVAEISGRTTRTVKDRLGNTIRENRTANHVNQDLHDFVNDRKRILVFTTGAGGSSMDYHAGLDMKNQRLRNHYICQYGQRADQALQGIGRTNRSAQKQPPKLWIASTNLPAEMIYRSQIMQKIQIVGASSHGNRNAQTETFAANASYRSATALAAYAAFANNLTQGNYSSLQADELSNITGIREVEFKNLNEMQYHRFLTRIARSSVTNQKKIMSIFDKEIENTITNKIIDRAYDTGPEYINTPLAATNEAVIHTDPQTTGEIKRIGVKGEISPNIVNFDQAWKEAETYNIENRIIHKRFRPDTNQVFIQVFVEEDPKTMENIYRIIEPDRSFIAKTFDQILINSRIVQNEDQMRQMWEAHCEEIVEKSKNPSTILTGTLLSTNALFKDFSRKRNVIANLDDGRQVFGIIVNNDEADKLEEQIKLYDSANSTIADEDQIDEFLKKIHNGETAILNNGYYVSLQNIDGDDQVEFLPKTYHVKNMLKSFSSYNCKNIGDKTHPRFVADNEHDFAKTILNVFKVTTFTMSPDWSKLDR
jgi:P-loop containing NTP hydrolase pore-1/C-terminal domain on Strawberry notch homologue